MNKSKFISLRDIEGIASPHQSQLEEGLKRQVKGLDHISDISGLAAFIGGEIEKPCLSEDWAISKEVFPDVNIHFIFNHADEEFPANLRVFYSGDKAKSAPADILAGITMCYVGYMVKYTICPIEQ